jgi:hypothetical protein
MSLLAAAGDAQLELAGQVGVLAVAGEEVGDRLGDRVGVQHLVGVQARHRAAEHVAGRVAAGLHGGHTHRLQPAPDLGDGADPDPVELDVLAGGDVEVGVAEHRVGGRAAGEGFGDLADGSRLGGVQAPAGDLDAEHERVAALSLGVQAHPFQALDLAGDGLDGLGAFPGVAVQDRVAHVQRMALELPLLDLVELLDLAEVAHPQPRCAR